MSAIWFYCFFLDQPEGGMIFLIVALESDVVVSHQRNHELQLYRDVITQMVVTNHHILHRAFTKTHRMIVSE